MEVVSLEPGVCNVPAVTSVRRDLHLLHGERWVDLDDVVVEEVPLDGQECPGKFQRLRRCPFVGVGRCSLRAFSTPFGRNPLALARLLIQEKKHFAP